MTKFKNFPLSNTKKQSVLKISRHFPKRFYLNNSRNELYCSKSPWYLTVSCLKPILRKKSFVKKQNGGKQRISEHTSYMVCFLFGCAKPYCNISKSLEKYLYVAKRNNICLNPRLKKNIQFNTKIKFLVELFPKYQYNIIFYKRAPHEYR